MLLAFYVEYLVSGNNEPHSVIDHESLRRF